MATRGAIARLTGPERFEGRYHHWDSYVGGLGRTLFHLYRTQFDRDLDAMLRVLLDEHPAGWSTINGARFDQTPGYQNPPKRAFKKDGTYTAAYARYVEKPKCYCHGTRREQGWQVTQANASESGVEYVYAFDVATRQMHVLSSVCEDGRKMVGMFGVGDPSATWRTMAVVDLDSPDEIDWVQVECGPNFEFCRHRARHHFQHLTEPERGAELGMQTYLGREALDFHDAWAVRIEGRVYRLTGSGHSSGFALGRTGSSWAHVRDAWIASLVDADNPEHRIEHPVAHVRASTYTPYPGVTWLFPPTQAGPATEQATS